MKKVLALLAMTLMIVGLTGCLDDPDAEPGPRQEQQQQAQLADPAQDQPAVRAKPALFLYRLRSGITFKDIHYSLPLRLSVSSGLPE